MAIFDSAESNGGDIFSDENVILFDEPAPDTEDRGRCWTCLGLVVTREPRRFELSPKRVDSARDDPLLVSESILPSASLSLSRSSNTQSKSPSSSAWSSSPSSSCIINDSLYLFRGSSCLRKRSSVVGALRFGVNISFCAKRYLIM
jgi:hypothetical protein